MGFLKFDDWESCHNSLRLHVLEFSEAEFEWRGRNTYSCNRCFLVCSGQGRIRNHTGNERLELSPGNAYFLPEQLDLEFEFEKGLNFLCCHFHLEILPGMDAFRLKKNCSVFPFPIRKMMELRRLFYSETKWPEVCRLEHFLWGILAEFPFSEEEKWDHWSFLREKYGRLLNHIRKNRNAHIGIDDLAEFCGMSRDSLSRHFSRDFGIPLKTFLQEEVLSEAERLLSCGDDSIKEIAGRLQFSSEYYFSRFFKNRKGISPSEFRKTSTLFRFKNPVQKDSVESSERGKRMII